MHGEIVILIIRDACEDARLFMDGILDGDALRHRLLAGDHVLAMPRADQRGLAHLAMADRDRPDTLELFR